MDMAQIVVNERPAPFTVAKLCSSSSVRSDRNLIFRLQFHSQSPISLVKRGVTLRFKAFRVGMLWNHWVVRSGARFSCIKRRRFWKTKRLPQGGSCNKSFWDRASPFSWENEGKRYQIKWRKSRHLTRTTHKASVLWYWAILASISKTSKSLRFCWTLWLLRIIRNVENIHAVAYMRQFEGNSCNHFSVQSLAKLVKKLLLV